MIKKFMKYTWPFFVVIMLIGIGCNPQPKQKMVDEHPVECAGADCTSPEIVDEVMKDTIQYDSIPVFEIKYHILVSNDTTRLDSVDLELLDLAHQSLNDSYKGVLIFDKNDTLDYHQSEHTLNVLYEDYIYGGKLDHETFYGQLRDTFSVTGKINIFVSKTELDGAGRKLLGFTPILRDAPWHYAKANGVYDALGLSFEGLFQYDIGSALIHELGHWFGLSHPWQYPDSLKVELGLDSDLEYCVNHMNYSCFLDRFTPQQLEFQLKYTLAYRYYLIHRWELKIK